MEAFEYALVVFADLRGFTAWSSQAAVAHHLQPFMSDFYDIFRDARGSDEATFLKPNGDGILWVKSTGGDPADLDGALDAFVDKTCPFIENSFSNLVQKYMRLTRSAVPLALGFGISSGVVYRLQFDLGCEGQLTDFASGVVNTAARLCDLARPSGMLISAEAFPGWRPSRSREYELAQVDLRGICATYAVWISTPRNCKSIQREKRTVSLEFHVGTVCYEPRRRLVLLAHRRADRALFPGLWETGGGQMFLEEGIDDTAARIALTEFGIRACVERAASMVPFRIETRRSSIPGIKVLCMFDGDDYTGYMDQDQHLETRAVPIDAFFSTADWPDGILIPGTRDVVRELLNRAGFYDA